MESQKQKTESAGKTTITGTINYTIVLEEGSMSCEYDGGLQSDLACTSISSILAQSAKKNLTDYLKGDKNNKEAGERLNKAGQGLLWLRITWQSLYSLWQQKQENDKTRGEIKEVTVTTQNIPTDL